MAVESNRAAPLSWARVTGRIFLGALVVAAFGVVVALVVFPPSGYIRQVLADAVLKATGRTFAYAGDPALSFNPRPVVTFQRAVLGAPAGAPGPETVRAEKLEAQIDPLALFTGRLAFDFVALTRAAITVRPEDSDLGGKSGGGRVSVSEVRVGDSAVNYLVTAPNPVWRVDQVTLNITGLGGTGAVRAAGRLRWRGEMVEIDGTVASLAALTSAEGATFQLAASSRRADATLDGRVAPKAAAMLTANLKAKSGSARDALRWLADMGLGTYSLAGPATLEGQIGVSAGEAKIERATLKLDAGEGQGDVKLGFAGAKPRVEGKIAWKELDLLRLMGETPQPAAAAQLDVRPFRQGPVIESAWQSLAADLANLEAASTGAAAAAPAPRYQGRNTWSTQPLDLSGLSAADVDIDSTAAVLKYGRIDLRNSRAHLAVKDSRLVYTVNQVEIGGGKAAGKIELDGSAASPRVSVDVRADEVPAESVLTQLFSSLLLSGSTKLNVGVEGRGRTPQDIITSLAGKADVALKNGAFHGFDLRRSLLTWWRPHKFDAAARTSVQSVNGQFALSNGILRTSSPFTVDGDVKISAEGAVEIAKRLINQDVRIKVSPPPDHLSIPVRVSGNWSHPKIAWDWKTMFESQGVLGSPLSVAAADEPIPPEVKAQIARVLAGPAAASFGPEARRMLETIGDR